MEEGNALVAPLGELRFTLEITRKETGKVEKVDMVGYLDPKVLQQLKEKEDGRNS